MKLATPRWQKKPNENANTMDTPNNPTVPNPDAITLRDYVAVEAMAALIRANPDLEIEVTAESAFQYADEFLRVREEASEPQETSE